MTMVRQAERIEVALPGRLSVANIHRAMVRLRGDRDSHARWSDVDIVDVSEGGLGLITPGFMPRGTRIELHVHGLGETEGITLLQVTAVVRQCRMTDGRPAYFVGCSLNAHTELEQQSQRARVKELLRWITAGEPITRATVERLDWAAAAATHRHGDRTPAAAAGGAGNA
ncbi:MAG: PilZ domain-containing protein [Planctomycetota bacterium]